MNTFLSFKRKILVFFVIFLIFFVYLSPTMYDVYENTTNAIDEIRKNLIIHKPKFFLTKTKQS